MKRLFCFSSLRRDRCSRCKSSGAEIVTDDNKLLKQDLEFRFPKNPSASYQRASCRPGTEARIKHHAQKLSILACVWAIIELRTNEQVELQSLVCTTAAHQVTIVLPVAVLVFKVIRLQASQDGNPFADRVRRVYRLRTKIQHNLG